MKLEIDVVDAFTQQRFGGNPAAVVVLEHWLEPAQMQAVAAENNLSETAFLLKEADGAWRIRWFSPLTEIDFCGHASLASAYVLIERGLAGSPLTLRAAAVGDFVVVRHDDGLIEMDFPSRMPEPVVDVPAALLEGLSIPPLEVWRNQQAYFAVLPNAAAVRSVEPRLASLANLAPYDVVVTAQGDGPFDCVSRYFWPANGGAEDPVTGSIHAGLAPFWGKRLGVSKLLAQQASARVGVLHCELVGERVRVAGHAVPYLSGTITI
ncbi:PhzF family phenazine biosynthesis protein [Chitinibacteraceae bacterium HSL-7]